MNNQLLLFSNCNKNIFPLNSANHFFVNLPEPIQLESERQYGVALREISYSSTIPTLLETDNIRISLKKKKIGIDLSKKEDFMQYVGTYNKKKKVFSGIASHFRVKNIKKSLGKEYNKDWRIALLPNIKFKNNLNTKLPIKVVFTLKAENLFTKMYMQTRIFPEEPCFEYDANKFGYYIEPYNSDTIVATYIDFFSIDEISEDVYKLKFTLYAHYLFDNNKRFIDIHMEPKKFDSEMQLIQYINSRLSDFVDVKFDIKDEKAVVNNLHKKMKLILNENLMYILGFKTTKLNATMNAATFKIDLQRGIYTILVYMNICALSLTGDKCVPLLKSVHTYKNLQAKMVSYNIESPIYVPLNRKFIDVLEIELRDIFGNLIPFLSGVSSLLIEIKAL